MKHFSSLQQMAQTPQTTEGREKGRNLDSP